MKKCRVLDAARKRGWRTEPAREPLPPQNEPALARRRGPPSTRTLIEIALKQASACPHAGAGGARSRAISVRLESDDRLYIVAPFGLADLFARRLRPNPRRRTVGFARAAADVRRRWPEVVIGGES